MPYVTSVERIGIEKGHEQGLREGLLAGMELGLELKFGAAGLQLLPAIQQIQNVEALRSVHQAIKTATTVDEIQRLAS